MEKHPYQEYRRLIREANALERKFSSEVENQIDGYTVLVHLHRDNEISVSYRRSKFPFTWSDVRNIPVDATAEDIVEIVKKDIEKKEEEEICQTFK